MLKRPAEPSPAPLKDRPILLEAQEMVGSVGRIPTYRRVAEDGVEVTQCPPMPAWGYGLDEDN